MRFLTGGESHGAALLVIVEGVPAHLSLGSAYINAQLARRQKGFGRGGRMAIEQDSVEILSGVRGGRTLGSPISLLVKNLDWPSWEEVMAVEGPILGEKVTKPRPGHADLSGAIKYGHRDMRNVLERASARETAIRTAVGAVARRLLEELGVHMYSHVVSIGGIRVERVDWDRVEDSPLRCGDPHAEERMMEAIEKARVQGNSLGGVFEVRVKGLPPGLGSYVHWDRRLDGQLAQAVISIPGVKGVEIGEAFSLADFPGSQVHDPIYWKDIKGFYRASNRAGGLEGGMSNGEEIVVRGAMKPIPTLGMPLASVDIETKEALSSHKERSDVCAVPAAGVVAEAMVAWALAQAVMERMGGDTMEELKERWERYKEWVRSF
jgi:chorismate synthase